MTGHRERRGPCASDGPPGGSLCGVSRRVFLHIGQGKTGTSTIQDFMVSNREGLAGRGYL